MDRRRLRLALLLLLGGLGVFALLAGDATVLEGPANRAAGPEGERAVPGLLAARQPTLRAGAPLAGPDAAAAGAGETTGEAVEEPRWVALRIETRDGLSGRPVPATWNLGTGKPTAGPYPAGMKITEAARARSRQGVLDSIAAWERGFLEAGAVREASLPPGEGRYFPYVLRLPTGYVRDEPSRDIRGNVAARVREVLWVVPVWEEAVLDLHVLDSEGQPAHDVRLGSLFAAGRRRDVVMQARGSGDYRIRGIPRLEGEPVRAVLFWGREAEPEEEFEVEESEFDLQDPQLVTVIPPGRAAPWELEVRLAKPRGPLLDSIETDNDRILEEDLEEEVDSSSVPVRLASIQVRVLGWDGTPVPGASVVGEQTDAQGEVVLLDLSPGEHSIWMHADGRFSTRRTCVLAPGERAHLTLREPRGATMMILVTDEQGRPRPHARLDVHTFDVFDVVDGVQRLDFFTDAYGRRRLERVEPGTTIVTATWGSRRGAKIVEFPDGETVNVHIVVK